MLPVVLAHRQHRQLAVGSDQLDAPGLGQPARYLDQLMGLYG